MNCDVMLTAEEFKTIHNTLWAMQYQGMDGKTGAEKIREALAGAYKQDREAFDRKGQHYTNVKAELGIRGSDWSIYEVDNLSERHPFEGADRVVYRDHWGEQPVQCSINGLTWAALWVAANACIRDSGDDHHTFIEAFRPSKDDPSVLYLVTGS